MGSSPIIPGEPYSIAGPSPDINLDHEGGVKKLFQDLKEAATKSKSGSSSSSSSTTNSEPIKFLKHVQLPLTAGLGKPESGKNRSHCGLEYNMSREKSRG